MHLPLPPASAKPDGLAEHVRVGKQQRPLRAEHEERRGVVARRLNVARASPSHRSELSAAVVLSAFGGEALAATRADLDRPLGDERRREARDSTIGPSSATIAVR